MVSTPDYDMPPMRATQPMRVDPETNKAVLDEEERRKRVAMNRQLSRATKPALQRPVGQSALSENL